MPPTGIGTAVLAASLLSIAALAQTAFAHHSQAMFDATRRITLTGVVKEFQWVNPHIGLKLLVPDGSGVAVEWTLEGSGVAQLRSRGWRRNSVMPGETLTVVVHPLRSGAPGGALTRVFRADGTLVGAAPAPGV